MAPMNGQSAIAAIYADKPAAYFANAPTGIVERLGTGSDSAVLELGCGAGGTGRALLAAGKAGRYVGIELSQAAAQKAAEALTEVLVGDVEVMDLTAFKGQFDALIVSEVLEHLTDPWTTLAKLVSCLKPGGEVVASSPNVAHWTALKTLAMGRFDYEDKGRMDRTHLRWFTPATFRELFEGAGVEVLEIGPVTPFRPKARLLNRLTGGRLQHLFISQIAVRGRRRA
jgi:2-polyprenyl-3-methyl-5-hydroxy-6-metoxy-1,4-benzoquinol methylase